MVDTFTHFLYDLSMGLTSQECTELEFLAGGYSSHCCCTGRDGGSPAHGVLMRIQRAGVFTEDNLGSLTGLLKIMGRNDLAQKCTSYGEKISTFTTSFCLYARSFQKWCDHFVVVQLDCIWLFLILVRLSVA